MKYLFLVSVFGLLSFVSNAQTRLYENPDFDQIAKEHKVIGILPFEASVSLRPNQMKKMTPGQLEKMEKAEGKGIQHSLYSWFLTRKKRGKLTVEVQNPSTSNMLLSKAGITSENFKAYTPEKLAEVLGVDAVIMGTFETSKPMSEVAAIAINVLFDEYGATNNAVLNLSIYNASDGEVLVNYHKGVSGSIGRSEEDLVNRLMRKASRRIAYTRKS